MTISFTTTKTSKEQGTCKTTNEEVQGFVGFKRQPNKTQQGKVRSSRPLDRRRGSGGGGGGRRPNFFFVSVWYKYKGGEPPGPLVWIRHCVLSTPVIKIYWILQYLFHFKEFWAIGESCISSLEGRGAGGGGRGSKRRQWLSGEVADCHASLNQRRYLGAL